MHGRISNTQTSLISHEAWRDEEGCALQVRSEVREGRVFGINSVLRRRISARLDESRIRMGDTVKNEGFEPEPLAFGE